MSEKDKGNILAIKEAIEKILSFTKDIQNENEFYDDVRTFDAVLMNFVVIGESVARLSTDFKNSNNHVDWQKIKGFRNIVVHDYFGIDPEDVWQIVSKHLSKLQNDIDSIVSNG